ncbi:hypothetical protein OG864_21465 [Streptomyces sp. NBC_00124]|uniref:hypothetical protein n=1 Tax=Streptomyces sp. NBC_00124 TaxID=2975662 RepID=UPI002257EF76|nr:hypothetical protein [Streptomyces sp. NBC_00124]MCX5361282.1 hypothetical protein [Streptomyces sp. NBC_00124]
MSGWRGGRRRLGALAGVLAAALGLTLWGAGSASAGGPTSVLIVSPGSTETASLYHSDKKYGELQRLLGEPDAGTADKPPEADLAAGPQINVTWMLHDVTPWRVDRVHPAVDSKAVWIHTAANLDASTNGTWHRAEQPAVLRGLLENLGVMGEASGGDYSVEYPPPWDMYGTEPAEATEPTPAAAPAQRPGSGDGADWWWALPGLAAGAVLALVLRPFATRLPEVSALRRHRVREPGPRQELRDL